MLAREALEQGLRLRLAESLAFRGLLAQVKEVTLDGLAHGERRRTLGHAAHGHVAR